MRLSCKLLEQVEIVPHDILWSTWGSHQTLWNHLSQMLHEILGHTVKPSIDQTFYCRDLVTELDLITVFDVITQIREVSIEHLQRVRLANRGRLLLRTPGPVPLGTCICSNVETIHSWTCHVYGPFEFRTSLGTSILLTRICTFIAPRTSFFQWDCLKCITWLPPRRA